jgi:hypothetical protein
LAMTVSLLCQSDSGHTAIIQTHFDEREHRSLPKPL